LYACGLDTTCSTRGLACSNVRCSADSTEEAEDSARGLYVVGSSLGGSLKIRGEGCGDGSCGVYVLGCKMYKVASSSSSLSSFGTSSFGVSNSTDGLFESRRGFRAGGDCGGSSNIDSSGESGSGDLEVTMRSDRGVAPSALCSPIHSSGSVFGWGWVSTSIDSSTVCNVLSRKESLGGEFAIFLGGDVGGVVIDEALDG